MSGAVKKLLSSKLTSSLKVPFPCIWFLAPIHRFSVVTLPFAFLGPIVPLEVLQEKENMSYAKENKNKYGRPHVHHMQARKASSEPKVSHYHSTVISCHLPPCFSSICLNRTEFLSFFLYFSTYSLILSFKLLADSPMYDSPHGPSSSLPRHDI